MVKNSKNIVKKADWSFILLIFTIITINLIILSSASANIVSGNPYYYLQRQILWVLVGSVVMIITALFDYHRYIKLAIPMYIITILLLIGVLFTNAQNGSHRWYNFGFMDFQPSELAKIIMVIILSIFLSHSKNNTNHISILIKTLALIGLPAILILAEPDLGTALIFGIIFLTLIWLSGINRKVFIAIILIILLVIAAIFIVLYDATDGFTNKLEASSLPNWFPLKPYQMTRLIIFINPYMDPLDSGYHIIQSQIAIGSGGVFGKGYGQGTQVQGNFLPYHHTDFIFSVVGEEFGFVGAAFYIIVYLLLLLKMLSIAVKNSDKLGTLIAGGITALFAFQIFVNIGMTIGIMPITGLALPLLSYGGSSMLTNMLALGLVISVQMYNDNRIF